MKIESDYNQAMDALAIRFNRQIVHESDEVRDGVIFDYNAAGDVIGIEILHASRLLGLSRHKSHVAVPATKR